ncbi:MAG: hypothetical protein WAM91_11910 [Candidatus Acidiferrales bacterium]
MRGKWAVLAVLVALVAGIAMGQAPAQMSVDPATMYCSGLVTTEAVPNDSYIISGEQSDPYFVFQANDLVYINRGSGQGVKVGDEYLVIRAVNDQLKQDWFHSQSELMRAMGQTWADIGRIRVLHADAKVSTAQIVSACEYMQRGDLIRPFVERPAPAFKPLSTMVDAFAPAKGKTGMLVTTKDFGQVAGNKAVVYVNLGSSQGLQVGSLIRFFRRQGDNREYAYQTAGMQDQVYGYGSSPARYTWEGLPRDIVGEGIVVRVSNNSASVMITATRHEIYVGDYAEVE